jgi:hypothetical protein
MPLSPVTLVGAVGATGCLSEVGGRIAATGGASVLVATGALVAIAAF